MQTNIEIPDDDADELCRQAPQPGARSALVEKLPQEYFRAHPAACSELELINDHADELNDEACDVLEYQVILPKSVLTDFVGSLSPTRSAQLRRALAAALDL